MFAAAGLKPPTTLAQLDTDAAKLTKQTSRARSPRWASSRTIRDLTRWKTCPLETYGWLFGGSWTNSKGTPTPASAANIAALEWEQSFYKKFGAQNVTNFISSAGAYLTVLIRLSPERWR